MSTRGLRRREKKERIKTEKEAARQVAEHINTIMVNLTPLRRKELFEVGRDGFYGSIHDDPADVVDKRISSVETLKATLEFVAANSKDPDIQAAFSWAAGFERDSSAKEFVRSLNPTAFDNLLPK